MSELMTHTGVGELSSLHIVILHLLQYLCFVLGAVVCRADAATFLISLARFSRILSFLLAYFTAHCSTLCYLHHHNKFSVSIVHKAGVEVQDDVEGAGENTSKKHLKHAILKRF